MEENDHTQFPTLLSGAAVNIKHLEITINDNFSDAETFAAFINSIHRLEEITFHVDDRDLDEYGKSSDPLERGSIRCYWNAILDRHGSSLRKVEIGWIYSSVQGWTTNFIEPLLSAAQTVEELTLEVSWTRFDDDIVDYHVWVKKFLLFPDNACAGKPVRFGHIPGIGSGIHSSLAISQP